MSKEKESHSETSVCASCGLPIPEDREVKICPRCLLEEVLRKTRAALPGDETLPHSGSPAVALPEPEKPRYERGLPIAKGGMGEVIEARELPVGRRVAMKVIHEAQRRNAAVRARFIEEAQITGQLEHPSIVPMHDLSIDDRGNVFYTMKRVEGETLGAILARLKKGDAATLQAFPLSRLLTIFQKICDAIAFAHSRGVIHRDLKPENFMVGTFGEVLVMDWGLAKVLNLPDLEITIQNQLAEDDDEVFPRTVDGTVMGTIGYMPPEQAEANKEMIGFPSDIYALGAVLYQILTLQKTVQTKSLDEGLSQTISGDFPAPTKLKETKARHCPGNRVPQSLSAVAMRALSKKPEDRYHTVEELQQEIEAYQSGFATAAEEAGFWTNLRLFIGRHKIESFAAILIGLIVTGSAVFLFKAWRDADEQRKVADEQRELTEQQRKVADQQRKLAEDNEAVAKERATELARRVSRDWVFKGDLLAEGGNPNGALLHYAEAFRAGLQDGALSAEEEAVHRFRLGQFLGIAPRFEAYDRITNLGTPDAWVVDPQGKAFCGQIGQILVRDSDTWQHIRTIPLPNDKFRAGNLKSFSSNCFIAYSTDGDQSLLVIEVGESQEQDRISNLRHDSVVIDFAVKQTEGQVLTIEADGYLNRWSVQEGKILERLKISEGGIKQGVIEISPDGKHCALFIGFNERRTGILCAIFPQLELSWQLNFKSWLIRTASPNMISFSHDSQMVAFGFMGESNVFQVSDGITVPQGSTRSEPVHFSQLEHKLITITNQTGLVEIENFNGGKLEPSVLFDPDLRTMQTSFRTSHDGSRILFSSYHDKRIRLYHFPSRRPFPSVINTVEYPNADFGTNLNRVVIQGFPFRIPAKGRGPMHLGNGRAQFSFDGGEVFSQNKDNSDSFLRKTGESEPDPSFTAPPKIPFHIGACDRESGLWWFGGQGKWYVQEENGGFRTISVPEGIFLHYGAVSATQPFGQIVVTSGKDKSRQIWRFPEGRIIDEISGTDFESDHLRALPGPNNRYILFGLNGPPEKLRFYDLATRKMTVLPAQGDHKHYQGLMRTAVFTPDSRWLLARNELFSVEDGVVRSECVLDRSIQIDALGACVIAPNGEWGGFVDTEWNVHLFFLPKGIRRTSPLIHPAPVTSLAASPDGRWLATGCKDGKVRLWDVNSGSLVSYPLDTGERDLRSPGNGIEFLQFNALGTLKWSPKIDPLTCIFLSVPKH